MKTLLLLAVLFSLCAHADYVDLPTSGGVTANSCPANQFANAINASGTLSCSVPSGGGTVTAVTGVAPIVSSGGTTPAISCNVASGSQPGCLSTSDWNTFNNKQPSGTYVTAVTATGPLASSGGTTPNVTVTATPSPTASTIVEWDASSDLNAVDINLSGLTASDAVVTDASKNLASSSTTAAELAFVHNVTSSIQTQLNGKQATGNYITALTGDVTATGPGSVTATLKNTGTAGTYGNVTTDAQGRVTSGIVVNPISGGGTNSGTALNNNSVMVSAAGSIVELGAMTQGQIVTANPSGVPVVDSPLNPINNVVMVEECMSAAGAGTDGQWSTAAASGGTAGQSTGTAAHPGICQISTGTTNSAGSESVRKHTSAVVPGGGIITNRMMVTIDTNLSTGTQTFGWVSGLMNQSTSLTPSIGSYWSYNPTLTFTCTGTTTNSSSSVTTLAGCVGAINPSSIQTTMAVTDSDACIPANTTVNTAPGAGTSLTLNQNTNASGCGAADVLTFTIGDYYLVANAQTGTARQVTSTKAVAGTWVRIESVINAAGTSISYLLNGTSVATIATNVPANAIGQNFFILKSNGTGTAGLIDVDYWYFWEQLTTAR